MCEVAWDPLRGPYIENYVPGAKKIAKCFPKFPLLKLPVINGKIITRFQITGKFNTYNGSSVGRSAMADAY